MNTVLKTFLSTLAIVAGAATTMGGEVVPSTFCNPLPIPDYPVGRLARIVTNGEPANGEGLWLLERKEQFRELADPTAVWDNGKWYLYPSVDWRGSARTTGDLAASPAQHP